MVGGAGDDAYVVDGTLDLVSEAGGSGVDTVFTILSFTLGAGFENLVLTGGDSVSGTGNGLANAIIGNDAANLLVGGGQNDSLTGNNGADTLNGGIGADTLVGGLGADRYIVDSLADVLVELPGEGSDQVITAIAWTLAMDFESLQLTGAAHVAGTGNAASNRLSGNDGNNLLTGLDENDDLLGGGGADTLVGGAGRDALNGGAGADLFLIGSATEGPDKIVDFAPGVDDIALVASGFAGGFVPGALNPANFVAHASSLATAPGGTAQFIYHTGNGALFFDADGTGGAGAVRIATLLGSPAVTIGDFLLI
jgi:Ca2+-binding RTX toxin-like protein